MQVWDLQCDDVAGSGRLGCIGPRSWQQQQLKIAKGTLFLRPLERDAIAAQIFAL
jgi:hypothetical protein